MRGREGKGRGERGGQCEWERLEQEGKWKRKIVMGREKEPIFFMGFAWKNKKTNH